MTNGCCGLPQDSFIMCNNAGSVIVIIAESRVGNLVEKFTSRSRGSSADSGTSYDSSGKNAKNRGDSNAANSTTSTILSDYTDNAIVMWELFNVQRACVASGISSSFPTTAKLMNSNISKIHCIQSHPTRPNIFGIGTEYGFFLLTVSTTQVANVHPLPLTIPYPPTQTATSVVNYQKAVVFVEDGCDVVVRYINSNTGEMEDEFRIASISPFRQGKIALILLLCALLFLCFCFNR